MSKRNLIGWIIGIGWIAYLFGVTSTMIGKVQTCSGTIWTWWKTFQIIMIIAIPFMAGLLAAEKKLLPR